MKRKHLFFIIYTVTLCGLLSCENEIPYNPEMRQPCLVMNALLEAGEGKTNEVYLYLSTGDNLDKVNDDAILTLYVNGRLTETPQAFKPEDIYPYPGEWLSPEDYETLLKNIHYRKYRLSTPLQPGDLLPCNPATSSVWKQQPKVEPFGLRQKYRFPNLPRISVWTPVPSRST